MTADRRRYPRLNAPVYWRSSSVGIRRSPVDMSIGGMRVYSDDALEIGGRLDIELFLPTEKTLVFSARVVWIDPLPAGGPARYEVGLELFELPEEVRRQLVALLA